jgi:hypothetical protein
MLEKYFPEGTDVFLPHVAVNVVVFGYEHPALRVLVFRMPPMNNSWALPGGYVYKSEHIDAAAYRSLKMLGIDQVFLKQIQTFGDPFRVPALSEVKDIDFPAGSEIMKWASQRFITVVYYGLVDYETTKLAQERLYRECKWMDVYKPEKMIQDHASIVSETRKLLINELQNFPVAKNLLADSFTMNEMRGLYEAILNRPIDRGTFRRKMLSLGIIEKVDQRKDARGRPSDTYRFNQEKYNQSLVEETKFGF